MGNRAVITTVGGLEKDAVGIYLHWNGGRDSVQAFLAYCKLRGFRPPEQDNYGWARLCQVVCNFFGGDLSVGIDRCSNLDCDNGNNGVYYIKNWEIVGREFFDGEEQVFHNLQGMLEAIDSAQPATDQISEKISEWGQEES